MSSRLLIGIAVVAVFLGAVLLVLLLRTSDTPPPDAAVPEAPRQAEPSVPAPAAPEPAKEVSKPATDEAPPVKDMVLSGVISDAASGEAIAGARR